MNATHAELEVATQSYISRLDAGGAAAVAEPPRALALPPAADCKVQEARMRAHGPSWADAMAHAGIEMDYVQMHSHDKDGRPRVGPGVPEARAQLDPSSDDFVSPRDRLPPFQRDNAIEDIFRRYSGAQRESGRWSRKPYFEARIS